MNDTGNPKGYRIMLVDDDNDILALLSRWLGKAGFQTSSATSGEQALQELDSRHPDLIISDLIMGGMSGMDLLAEVHRINPLLPVIMLSGQARIPDAVMATHLGSSAFLTKPVTEQELLEQVRHALRLAPDQAARKAFSGSLVYQGRAMSELVELAERVADSDVTVLISGATGTGKEVLAKAIHEASSRRERPFVAVNCGAIPEQLLESELFGHEKGAFTGASLRHEGLFRAADGGTLFLDEVGDMPLMLQVKLLRVLQDFEVRPVGSTRSYPVNVRVISATHRDLDEEVRAGRFREDLYYRLKVVPLQMPALEERREDIPILSSYLLQRQTERRGSGPRAFAPEALDYLAAASWPGNIRQLSNVVELCATLSGSATIPLSLVKKAMQDRPARLQTLKDAKFEFERNYLLTVMRITSGRVANAARIAGRNRTEFYKLLSQHGIDPADFRGDPAGAQDDN